MVLLCAIVLVDEDYNYIHRGVSFAGVRCNTAQWLDCRTLSGMDRGSNPLPAFRSLGDFVA